MFKSQLECVSRKRVMELMSDDLIYKRGSNDASANFEIC